MAKPAADKENKAINTPVLYDVTDTSAVDQAKPRTHDIMIDGQIRQITFKYGEPTKLTYQEAMKFLKDGFIVRDSNGQIIKKPDETDLSTLIDVGPDRVVARLDELTQASLYQRVISLPDGEVFNARGKREDMIAFITEKAKEKIRTSIPEHEPPDMLTDDDLDSMGLTAEDI